MVLRVLFSTALLGAHFALAEEAVVRPVFGAHPGYLFNVVEEKDRRDIEMVMLEKPKEKPKKNLSEKIFNKQLTKEFQDQYRYRFGQTQAEQVINNPGRTDEYTYYNRTNLSIIEYQYYQRQFGNYMLRRLTEYHIDNWAKNDPDFKPIYQAKDRFSNLNVQMKKGYKLKWKYNLSGPSMEASLENPYDIETRVQMMMNGLLSKPNEVIYTFGYKLSPRMKLDLVFREIQTLTQVVLSRRMSKHISISLTGSSGQVPDQPQYNQNLGLVGFSWSE